MGSLKSEVHARYLEHEADMKSGISKPFKRLIAANMGNPHSYGQPYVTFHRQVLAMCLHPPLMEDPRTPDDIKKRAKMLLNEFPNQSLGSVTDLQGLPLVRRDVANYLRERDDGVPANPDNIFLQDCSKLVDLFLEMMADNNSIKPVGILTLIPTYPIYPAVIQKYRMCQVIYYLDPDNNWAIHFTHLKQVICDARMYCQLKGLVIVNPGNPTGHVMTRHQMEDLIKLCYNEELLLLADEVYQENILDCNKTYHSFKKIKHRMGFPYNGLELVSLNSASKGYFGEAGLRGGYMEFDQIDNAVKSVFRKKLGLLSCPNAAGQIAIHVIVKPPDEEQQSGKLFHHEKRTILVKLAQKAKVLVNGLNNINGFKVYPVQGGLFAYAQITNIPAKAIKEAKNRKLKPSVFWALKFLDETGIAVAPGSLFMEKPETCNFRLPILLPMQDIETITSRLQTFHRNFLREYE